NYRRHIAGVLVRRGLGVAERRVATRRGPGVLPREEKKRLPAASSGGRNFSPDQGDKISIAVAVNGVRRTASVEPRRSLVDFLRHDLGFVGTHVGCEHGVCGACTVMLDGRTVRSCLLFAAQADGAEIVTIEGVGTSEALHPLQLAFQKQHAVQCGFCTPGMILAAMELLRDHADPTEEEIRAGLGGNVCMCTGYVNIVRAVRAAVSEEKAQ